VNWFRLGDYIINMNSVDKIYRSKKKNSIIFIFRKGRKLCISKKRGNNVDWLWDFITSFIGREIKIPETEE
jgi:hypothetical protein